MDWNCRRLYYCTATHWTFLIYSVMMEKGFFSVKSCCPCVVQSQSVLLISTSRYCTIAWVCGAVLCLPCSLFLCFCFFMIIFTQSEYWCVRQMWKLIQRVQHWKKTGLEKQTSGGMERNNGGALGGSRKWHCCGLPKLWSLTLVWCHQQIQMLLGEVGPDCHHLFP